MLPAAAISVLIVSGCSAASGASPAASAGHTSPASSAAGSSSSSSAAGAGASSSAAGAGATQHIRIVANNNFRFAPSTVRVHTGKVRITLVDSGAYPHNLVIPAIGVNSATVSGDPGGTQISVTATFPHPGSYRFYCVYHQSAGMVGTFIVTS